MDLPIPMLCGQLLVAGFEGTTLPRELVKLLARGELGGVILFKRNLPDLSVCHELASAVVDHATDDLPPFIGIDEEGGRVWRLPEPARHLPPMRELCDRPADELRRLAAAVGRQLATLGFNIDFAPVLDVDSNPLNPVIGDRAFSRDPDVVARLGRAFITGLQSSGVMACGKHFPGHGDTNKDSHVELPFVKHGRERLDNVELPPFRAASHAKVAALMTAHVVYEALDSGVPATLSRKICHNLLRGELGYGGVLFSDDLEMKALANRLSVEESSVAAVKAGCDTLLVCKDVELLQRAHDALVHKAEQDDAFAQRAREAVQRALTARRQFPPRPLPDPSELPKHVPDADL